MVAPSATIVLGVAVRVEVAALAAAGLTVTGLLVPLELPSSALIVWCAGGLEGGAEGVAAVVGAGEGVGGGQDGLRVAGAEADGAGVGGGGVVVGVEGGDGEAAGAACGRARRRR